MVIRNTKKSTKKCLVAAEVGILVQWLSSCLAIAAWCGWRYYFWVLQQSAGGFVRCCIVSCIYRAL